MIIEDIDLDERINNPDNLANRLKIHKIERGRANAPDIPIEIKKTIAILGIEGDESQTEIGKSFGLVQSSVSQITRGVVTDGNGGVTSASGDLQGIVKDTRARVEGKRLEAESQAVESVLKVLNIIPSDISKDVDKKTLRKLKGLTGVARDLSTVANQVSKRGNGEFGDESAKQVVIHLYKPEQSKISDYEVVEGTVVR